MNIFPACFRGSLKTLWRAACGPRVAICQTLVYSHLQYAIGAWGGFGKTRLQRLNVLYNKITVMASLESMTRLDLTRVTIFGDSDSTRVTLRKMVTRLESSHVFHRMTRLESQAVTRVRVIFARSHSL